MPLGRQFIISPFQGPRPNCDPLIPDAAVAFTVTVSTLLALVTIVAADEIRDTREGETVTLKCRFSEQSAASDFSYYWARSTGNKFDNVAIKGVQLNTNYR
uniref:Ig-like domain-containing protein n=1 Tax=Anopheles minimus TaxID=112268 RepID=A0A182WA86_9DIPT